jgi:hypothetical protein
MKYTIHNGYRILGSPLEGNHQKDSEITRALQFLTAMDICETCIPSSKSELKLGNHIYDINYQDRTIKIS